MARPEPYPLRRLDGDFTPEDITGPDPHTTPIPPAHPLNGIAEAALALRLWQPRPKDDSVLAKARPSRAGKSPTHLEAQVLHRFETAPLARPPVAQHVETLTPAMAEAWLTLTNHWVGVAAQSGDLRFLNSACKLLGAVWALDPAKRWHDARLIRQVEATAVLIGSASHELAAQLAARPFTARHKDAPLRQSIAQQAGLQLARPNQTRAKQTTAVVLAGAGSGSPARLLTAVRSAGADLAGVCWYGPPPASPPKSNYAHAWYPPERPSHPNRRPALDIAQATATNWAQTAAILQQWQSDLVVLLGMPIVPPHILQIPPVGTINAHNGALPSYRGMDAVAWALLNNDPIVCTVHLVTTGVDAGPILVARTVPFPPGPTLRARVKDTQLKLLTTVIAQSAHTGQLPATTVQPAESARQFYRLHPHLKRILDASPYGTGGQT